MPSVRLLKTGSFRKRRTKLKDSTDPEEDGYSTHSKTPLKISSSHSMGSNSNVSETEPECLSHEEEDDSCLSFTEFATSRAQSQRKLSSTASLSSSSKAPSSCTTLKRRPSVSKTGRRASLRNLNTGRISRSCRSLDVQPSSSTAGWPASAVMDSKEQQRAAFQTHGSLRDKMVRSKSENLDRHSRSSEKGGKKKIKTKKRTKQATGQHYQATEPSASEKVGRAALRRAQSERLQRPTMVRASSERFHLRDQLNKASSEIWDLSDRGNSNRDSSRRQHRGNFLYDSKNNDDCDLSDFSGLDHDSDDDDDDDDATEISNLGRVNVADMMNRKAIQPHKSEVAKLRGEDDENEQQEDVWDFKDTLSKTSADREAYMPLISKHKMKKKKVKSLKNKKDKRVEALARASSVRLERRMAKKVEPNQTNDDDDDDDDDDVRIEQKQEATKQSKKKAKSNQPSPARAQSSRKLSKKLESDDEEEQASESKTSLVSKTSPETIASQPSHKLSQDEEVGETNHEHSDDDGDDDNNYNDNDNMKDKRLGLSKSKSASSGLDDKKTPKQKGLKKSKSTRRIGSTNSCQGEPISGSKKKKKKSPKSKKLKGILKTSKKYKKKSKDSAVAVRDIKEVHIPGQSEPVLRTVSLAFCDVEREVFLIAPVMELTKRLDRLWFSDEELEQIKQDAFTIADHFESVGKSSSSRMRGLERLLEKVFDKSEARKFKAWEAVFKAQFAQWEKQELGDCDYDDEIIAKEYKFNAVESIMESIQRASQDEAAIKKYMKSTKAEVKQLKAQLKS